MNRPLKASVLLVTGLAAIGGWGWAGGPSAQAEMVDITAVVDATAVQFIEDEATLVDRETLEVSAGQTGAAIASIEDLGPLGSIPLASATSRVFFRDPFTPGPPGEFLSEFGGELLAVMLDTHTRQEVTGDVFESRSIRVTPLEAEASPDGQVGVTGEMYLHGAVLIWSDRPDDDLETLEALVGFEIEREGEEPRFVLSGAIEVQGVAGSQIVVTTHGVLDETDIVEVDISADFPELGTVHLVMFPQLLLPYVYGVQVDEVYELTGRLRLKGTTVPDFVGVAVTAGGPFEDLAETLDRLYAGDVGTRLQERVEVELGRFPEPVRPVIAFEQLSEACAPLGVEAAGLVSLLGLASFGSGGRRLVRRRFKRWKRRPA